MKIRSFISGCAGTKLSTDEKAFFETTQPWGLILFGRNVDTPDQIRALTSSFREAVGRSDAPVFIDQEGGRVQRLKPPHWPKYPAGAVFGQLEVLEEGLGKRAAFLGGQLIAHDLMVLGIDVDCLPVLDIPAPGYTDAIGDRVYSHNVQQAAMLGKAAADGLLSQGVLPVLKHLPGHGRALVDSHLDLPQVDASLDEMDRCDFEAFRPLAGYPMGMTAHVVYQQLDSELPATLSATIIQQIIRGKIGFDGLLLSDDISMGALKMPLEERCELAITAGCDIILHCNGVFEEMEIVAQHSPELSGKALERVQATAKASKASFVETTPDQLKEIRQEFAALMKRVDWLS